jgi:hypothetical protein
MSSDDDEPHRQHASRQKATDDVFDYFELLSENSGKHLYDVQCNYCSKTLREFKANRLRRLLRGQANVVPWQMFSLACVRQKLSRHDMVTLQK